jgi:hypothetical protein
MAKKIASLFAAFFIFFPRFANADPIRFEVLNYSSDSLTFAIFGTMPVSSSLTQAFPFRNILGINYSGNLWIGGQTYEPNSLSELPISGAGPLIVGNTGGFGTPTNYSWLQFSNDLTGLTGSGFPVILTWGGGNFLNTSGTGSIDLYWGNLISGPDPAQSRNLLLASVQVENGRVVHNPIPEKGTFALIITGFLLLLALQWKPIRIEKFLGN